LIEARTDTPERLDGAILRGVDAGDRISFDGCGLRGAAFDNADFSGGNFSDAHLRRAEFHDAYLQEAEFTDADLPGAEFPHANLRGAEFHDAYLQEAEFTDADLPGAEFPHADLTGAEFHDADLKGAEFPHADLPGAGFPRANLRGAKFPDADLKWAKFPHADLDGAEFPDANLLLAEFPGADLPGAEFPHAGLTGAEFHDADLKGAEFPHAYLEYAEFPDANLWLAEFPDAYLEYAEFPDADLPEAEFPDADLRMAEFRDIDAFNANFRHANLQDTVFTSTDCREATFTSALLYETVFEDLRINSQTTFSESENTYYNSFDRFPTFARIILSIKKKLGYGSLEGLRPACVYEENELTTDQLTDNVHDPLEAARWVYRRLETLHEENALSEEARQFHISKEEAERKLYKERGNPRRHVKTLMWALTNHGESVRRLLGWWAAVIIGAGLLFPFVGGIKDSNGGTYAINSLSELGTWAGWNDLLLNIYFSIITFSTIGYGDLSPAAPGSRVLVAFESITGALLLALLIFVLGRRVAR
jgi:uncharacterized protein YjbI with pentapeptide repeats